MGVPQDAEVSAGGRADGRGGGDCPLARSLEDRGYGYAAVARRVAGSAWAAWPWSPRDPRTADRPTRKVYTLPGSHVHIGLVNVFLQVATGLYSLPGLRGSCSLPTSPGELKGRVFHSY